MVKVARVKSRGSNCNMTINFFTCEIILVSEMTLTQRTQAFSELKKKSCFHKLEAPSIRLVKEWEITIAGFLKLMTGKQI